MSLWMRLGCEAERLREWMDDLSVRWKISSLAEQKERLQRRMIFLELYFKFAGWLLLTATIGVIARKARSDVAFFFHILSFLVLTMFVANVFGRISIFCIEKIGVQTSALNRLIAYSVVAFFTLIAFYYINRAMVDILGTFIRVGLRNSP